jgi:hypothetical protein
MKPLRVIATLLLFCGCTHARFGGCSLGGPDAQLVHRLVLTDWPSTTVATVQKAINGVRVSRSSRGNCGGTVMLADGTQPHCQTVYLFDEALKAGQCTTRLSSVTMERDLTPGATDADIAELLLADTDGITATPGSPTGAGFVSIITAKRQVYSLNVTRVTDSPFPRVRVWIYRNDVASTADVSQ